MIARAGGSLLQMPEVSRPFVRSDPGSGRSLAPPWRAVLCLTLAVLALGLVVSCSRPPAPLRLEGSLQSAYPPKPPPKPRLAAAPAFAPTGAVTVVPGDTVYGIARRFGIPIRTIIEANDLSPPYTLRVGQRLALAEPRYHVVKQGETLYAISRLYGVDLASLARLNRVGPPYALPLGQRLLLPGAVVGARRMARAGSVQPTAAPAPAAVPGPSVSASSKVPLPPPRAGKSFAWPVSGKLISTFGAKGGGLHNDGLNIAAPRGTPVRAAENGVVAYAGNELKGFGNLLLVRHQGGWTTAYAHNDVLQVRRGDTVKRGQVIARLGSTGHVSVPQLHFEIRKGAKAVDPLRYLGRRSSHKSAPITRPEGISRAAAPAAPPALG